MARAAANSAVVADGLDSAELLRALRAFRKGDFSAQLPTNLTGIAGEIAEAFNDVVELNHDMMKEFTRLSTAVGKEGKISQRGRLNGAKGGWQTCIESVNTLIGDIAQPTEEVARVIGAVAKGDLSQTMRLDIDGRPLRGEFLRIGKTVNTMVGHLSSFSAEVTRVAREVGTEGKLGGQARVKGVAGTWKDLTDNVNAMANNLTNQVRNIADVTTAVARGDLSKKITVDVRGEILELKNTINTMVDQLSSFASEVSLLAREVGTEGKLGGQARVEGVAGVWKDLTDNVNAMATNLTSQVRNIAEVTTAVARGDLSQTMMLEIDGRPLRGEFLGIARVVNTMVGQLSSFSAEVTRVAREVGTEGKLGGQAKVEGVAGTWKDLTDNVNAMANNLTNQVRNIAEVTTAVARGDLSKKITVDVKGEILELKNTINTMVDQLSSFAAEVTRVAREVGTEGKLGGEARVEGVAGTWKDLTDNVNLMANNLTSQVRNIAEVTTAVARGDLSKKITVDVRGEIRDVKDTINTMVDQLSSFASEVTRVAREVGTEGKLGGQAKVEGVAGTWKDLTDNVNAMASNLTNQVRNIAEVTTAVAGGDLSKKITVDVKGEILELKNTINTMVDQLSSFAAEVTRVAREVGTEGKLGGEAKVEGVAGTWKDLTDNVNLMANNLTSQVRNIAEVTTAVARGDLSKKITVDVRGEILELKNTINTMVDQLSSFAAEVTRVAREVGTEGKLGGEAKVEGVAGTWKDLTDNVNAMANNLTNQVRNIAEVTTAVARGDLSKKITVDVKGEILELKNTINTMVDQLSSFAAEVTRVAREVGTEGKLGGEARVEGVAGTWKDLTDNVNMMANNLTNQVRGIAEVVTAVARGDLNRTLTVDAKGEIAALADTINGMIDTLATFGDQVTNVAREVGIEGKLGGQAKVPGAAGLWRNLTNNVNQLAANLTTQVRAIAEVATAVTKGDLTRSITVEASGEVAALKDNVNEMIRNLEETTLKNTEQDWLKTNLARFSRMLQGERDLVTVSNLVLSELTPLVNAQHSVFYVTQEFETPDGTETFLEMMASYAFTERKALSNRYRLREGLIGQCAYEKKRILLTNVPGEYIRISSGLGEAKPVNIVALPILFEGDVRAVLEIASIYKFSEIHLSFLDQLMESIGIMLNTIAANMRTEGLLKESQRLTAELQSQQEELKKTNDRLEQQAGSLRKSEELLRAQQEELRQKNEELEDKARLLAQEKLQVEAINLEVEKAKRSVEEKAEQLALTSKYKSEFLANMSHELRTPLNNMLILSNLLTENADGNMTEKQVEFARTILEAGKNLLGLINDILDLSKIESGTVTLRLEDIPLDGIQDHIRRSFEQVAAEKGLRFNIEFDEALPKTIYTEKKRLEQLLLNLLSNAFKFTDEGEVTVRAYLATEGWSPDHPRLSVANRVIAFSVEDMGIGIAAENTKHIFEAFQQVDGSTNRKYGGTGLGLSICREISHLLGGEITVQSELGKGSIFTLYLPLDIGRGEQPGFATQESQTESVAGKPEPESSQATDKLGIAPDKAAMTVLVVSDETEIAQSVVELAAKSGISAVRSTPDNTTASLVEEVEASAVVLIVGEGTAGAAGWVTIDCLKRDPKTCHIPIHVIAGEENRRQALHSRAFGFTALPARRKALAAALSRLKSLVRTEERRLLVVQSSKAPATVLTTLADDLGVETTVVKPGEALKFMRMDGYFGVVVDVASCGAHSGALLSRLRKCGDELFLPVIAYDARSTGNGVASKLAAEPGSLKRANSPERLLTEAAALLHRPVNGWQDKLTAALNQCDRPDPLLAGRRVVIIDDDIRNIFSLTAIFERHEMEVLHAEDGKSGLELLETAPRPDIVLVDIMMPEYDGYDTIRLMRGVPRLESLPVIAVTAKAMQGDREKCLEAGASDYIPKPVDIGRLLSIMRIWLSQPGPDDIGPAAAKGSEAAAERHAPVQ